MRTRLAVGRVIVYKSRGVDKTGGPFSYHTSLEAGLSVYYVLPYSVVVKEKKGDGEFYCAYMCPLWTYTGALLICAALLQESPQIMQTRGPLATRKDGKDADSATVAAVSLC